MKEWEYTFEPVAKAEWFVQIQKELKGKSIDSLRKEWWPGEPFLPLHHFEAAPQEPVILPERLFQSPPKLIEFVDTHLLTSDQVNTRLKEALASGAQQFILQIHGTTPIPFRHWTHDIHPDMVHWHLYPDADGHVDLDVANNEKINTLYIRLQRGIRTEPPNTFLSTIQKMKASSGLPLTFEYIFRPEHNWVEETATIFELLLSDLRNWNNSGASPLDFLNQCILCIHSDSDYFKTLIQIRVLHLVWNNLFAYSTRDGKASTDNLECHIHPRGGEKPAHYFIRTSMLSLASVLAGSSGLCIHHSFESGSPDSYRRINRNVHHLLEMECGLPRSQDVMAGSVAIDYYTRRWTEQIWNRLSLE